MRQHGFFVVTPALEGLHDRTPHLFWRWILDSLTEIHRLAVTHRQINLCGVSHGAALALAVAAERPLELDSLALISPRLHLGGWTGLPWRLHVPMPEALANWHAPFQRQPDPRRVRQKAAHAEHPLATASAAVSSTQRREARRLLRYVEGALERVHAPTLIIHTCEDAAAVTDLRYIQVHIGSQFKEVFLQSGERLIGHQAVAERTALKAVEFFNDIARRRALAAMVRS
jgi:carboxylesterase